MSRVIAANSKADAIAVIEKNKSDHQKIESLTHLGWGSVDIRPSQEYDDVAFTLSFEGKTILIEGGESHAHLVKLFPKAVKDLRTAFMDDSDSE